MMLEITNTDDATYDPEDLDDVIMALMRGESLYPVDWARLRIVYGTIFFSNNKIAYKKKNDAPISILGSSKSTRRDVWDYIRDSSEEEFRKTFDAIGRPLPPEACLDESSWHLGINPLKFIGINELSNPQRQKETVLRIRLPQIGEIERRYRKKDGFDRIVSDLRMNKKMSVEEIAGKFDLPVYAVSIFIRLLTKDKRFFVRSKDEKKIAGFLFDNGIAYEYEPKRIESKSGRIMIPDFHLPEHDLYIEYFGYYKEEYKKRTRSKIGRYKRLGIDILGLYPPDLKNLRSSLLDNLEKSTEARKKRR